MIQTKIFNDRSRIQDDRTGRHLWQFTDAPVLSEAVYFERQAFTADERYFVFRSERGGDTNLFRADVQTGDCEPITATDHTLDAICITMHPDGRTAVFISNNRLYQADIPNLSASPLLDGPLSILGELFRFSLTHDGRYLCICAIEHDRTCEIPDAINGKPGALAHLGLVDLITGDYRHLLEWPEGLSHPLINPHDKNLITFVQRGECCWNNDIPDERRTRTWLYDDTTGNTRRFLTPVRYRTITHESWSPDGNRFFFFDKQYPKWCPVSICSVDRTGGDWRVHYTSYEHWLGHGVVSPCGRYFISDCQRAGESPLILIDLETGRDEILCWPNTSQEGGHPEAAHCHPSFSPSGRYIIFTSDKTGTPQVYLYDREDY